MFEVYIDWMIIELDEFEVDLVLSKERGYVVDDEEWELGVCCIVVFIFRKGKIMVVIVLLGLFFCIL